MLACAVTILAGGRGASACSCVVETEEDAFGRADAVFTGVLTEMEELSNDYFSSIEPQRFVFDVDAVFKGSVAAQQTIVTARDGASCGLEITGQGPFVVFATFEDSIVSGAERGELYANLCGGTRALADGAVPADWQSGPPSVGPLPTEPAPAASVSSPAPSTTTPADSVAASTTARPPGPAATSDTGSWAMWVLVAGVLTATVVVIGLAVRRHPSSTVEP